MSSRADQFELAARRNGISVTRVGRREGLAEAVRSLVMGSELVALDPELSWLEPWLASGGLLAVSAEDLDPAELLPGRGAVAVRAAYGAVPETGSVVLAGSLRVQLITSLSERLVVLLDLGLLERGLQPGDLLRGSFSTGGPVYVVSGPSSTRDIEHLLVRGATGPREITCVLFPVGER